MGYPRLGELNVVRVYVGMPGTGKSTLALRDMVAMSRELGGAYLLAHDQGHRLPDRWPREWGGGPTGIVRHVSIDAMRKALKEGKPGVHAYTGADGLPVLRLGIETAAAAKRAAGGRVHVPATVVLLDEAAETDAVNPHRLHPEIKSFIAGRRHKHVALLMTTQSPQFCHYQFFDLSSELVLGSLEGRRAIKVLEDIGVSPSVTEQLPSTPPYRFFRIERIRRSSNS